MLGAQANLTEENYVHLRVVDALLIDNLVLGKVKHRARSEDLLQRENGQFRKDWVLCVDNSVADVDTARSSVLKLLLQFIEAILDLILNGSWQFTIFANEFRVVWMLVVRLHRLAVACAAECISSL